MNNKQDHDYQAQQEALNVIASKLGVIAYRPNYHAKANDKNTVLLYAKEDAEHNRQVDAEMTSYTLSQAADLMRTWGQEIKEKFIYKDPFWTFENSDINGMGTYQFANHGKLNLSRSNWKEVLEGDIRIALAKKKQYQHIAQTGGFLAPREADNVYNELNREIIRAMKLRDGQVFIGNINFHENRERIVNGEDDIYEEYHGGEIYNFAGDFCIPVKDDELRQLIISWNKNGSLPKSGRDVERITSRIEEARGINLIWF